MTAALAALSALPGSALAADRCDRVASPGSDTAQQLLDSLRPGETGCLHGGTYGSSWDNVLYPRRGGEPGAPLTLRSYPGERARLVGIIDIPHGSDYITLSGLDIEGTAEDGANTIKIYSRGVVLEESDITNAWRGRSCLILGNNEGGGQAVAPIVRAKHVPRVREPRERQPRPRRLCRERPGRRNRRQPLLQLGRLHDPALPQRAADPVRPQRRRRLRAVGARRHRVRRRRSLCLGRQRRRAERDRVRRDGCHHLLLGGPRRDRQRRARQLRLGVARRRHLPRVGLHGGREPRRQAALREPRRARLSARARQSVPPHGRLRHARPAVRRATGAQVLPRPTPHRRAPAAGVGAAACASSSGCAASGPARPA